MRLPILMSALLLAACSQAAPPQDERTEPERGALEDLAEEDIGGPVPIEAVPAGAQPVAPPPDAQRITEPAPQAATQRDSRLVGIWVNEDIINSGGSNFASYTTVMTMEIYSDGRIVQYTESIGGGGDWSYEGGRTLDFEGQWRGDGQTLSVFGMGLPDYTPAATYSFSGNYLVTQSDMGRLIWQKRG
jgi:hypothetical protein